jgi:signal transduction histidine kinase
MLLREVCHLHREVAPRAQILEQVPKGPLRVRGDHKLLFQAFSNLVSNAVKYSSGNAIVRVELRRHGDVAEIAVQDHGVGIPATDREHLFERYYRGSNISGIVGTGIGLYLVKMVVDLHGGVIEVTSEEGRGSRFAIRLPAAPEARDSPAIESADASSVAAKDPHRV